MAKEDCKSKRNHTLIWKLDATTHFATMMTRRCSYLGNFNDLITEIEWTNRPFIQTRLLKLLNLNRGWQLKMAEGGKWWWWWGKIGILYKCICSDDVGRLFARIRFQMEVGDKLKWFDEVIVSYRNLICKVKQCSFTFLCFNFDWCWFVLI